jgi:hypothetical protein
VEPTVPPPSLPPADARSAPHVTPPHGSSPLHDGATSPARQLVPDVTALPDARPQPKSLILNEHNYAVALSADQFVTQPIALTIASAAAAVPGTYPLV